MDELELQTREALDGKPVTMNIFPFQVRGGEGGGGGGGGSNTPPPPPPQHAPTPPRPLPTPQYAFNLFSHNSPMTPNGYNEEEMKLVKETAKIWGTDGVAITATCIRVPVMRAHAESINLELEAELDEADALRILASAPGVTVLDDRAANRFPTPLDASNRDGVFVGRVRRDISRRDKKGIDLFVCGDQIKKGAALNAVQVAELLL